MTEYDDGVLFGNALRLFSGVLPYHDFAMVQPPGSMLLIAPAALLAKAAGTTAGLAASRVLTATADTANIVLLGLLVRHRGPVAVLAACGCYAVYPDAIVAAHTFLLEPWLNLCCLVGALAIFQRDQVAVASATRLAWGGAAYGFAVAVKIWALVPFAVAVAVVAVGARRTRPAALFAGGAALGCGLPVLPFAVLAPGGLVHGVLISQAVRDSGAVTGPVARLTDLAGLHLLPAWLPSWLPALAVLLTVTAIVAACWAAARLIARRPVTQLDAYALMGAIAVTVMFLLPRLYYTHYGAFDGPFLALAIALPAGALRVGRTWPMATITALLALTLTAAAVTHVRAESHEHGTQLPATTYRLIPPGACVLTNAAAYTVAADRFYATTPGCPSMVDSFGTFFAMTGGRSRGAAPAALRPVIALWQTDLSRAQYVWFTSNTAAQIPWTRQLYAYFNSHFRLIGLAAKHWTLRYVPRPGLYIHI